MNTISPSSLANILSELPVRPVQPVVFVGHGSPMNAITDDAFAKSLHKTGELIGNPTAILVVSAHWLTKGTYVSTAEQPETIYDFSGFPKPLYEVQYPAKGAPTLATEVAATISYTSVAHDSDRGLDHGAWAVLKKMYPLANVPVFQISIDYHQPARFHYELAAQLVQWRKKGVLIVASGNIVHNLREINWTSPQPQPYDWATEFDQTAKKLLIEREHKKLIDWKNLGFSAQKSIPTPDHYYPMLYAIGLQQKNEEITFIHEEMQMSSVSLRSFIIGI